MVSHRLRVGVLGASGYTGAETVRLLSQHPRVELVLLTADRHAGASYDTVFPHLGGLALPSLISLDDVEWAGLDVDVVFCGLPHGTVQEIVAGLLHRTGHGMLDEMVRETPGDLASGMQKAPKVIDISADFRLQDLDSYAEWYGHRHLAPELQKEAVYGLTELKRDAIREARLVACPGCYPTAALLPLAPLLEAEQILPEDIIIDAKSGVTGAGRAARQEQLFTEISGGMHAYGVARHRHTPEIEQELGLLAGEPVTVSFTPHLVPMNRGILATVYVRLAPGADVGLLRETLTRRYAGEPFARVLPEGVLPATRHVRGSNFCLMNVFEDRLPGRAIIVAVLDNLVKGASGQAIQNMNAMFGFDETLALTQQPLFP